MMIWSLQTLTVVDAGLLILPLFLFFMIINSLGAQTTMYWHAFSFLVGVNHLLHATKTEQNHSFSKECVPCLHPRGGKKLLKIPCALAIEPRGPELVLIWKLPSWELAFLVPEVSVKASKQGKKPTVLPSYDTYGKHQQPTWPDNTKYAAVTPIL